MGERHPSRTILLLPRPDDPRDALDGEVDLRCFVRGRRAGSGLLGGDLPSALRPAGPGAGKRGHAAAHPGPPGLPALARRAPVRRPPRWSSSSEIADRLVARLGRMERVRRHAERLPELFDRIAVSDIAWAKVQPWREACAALWPEIAEASIAAGRWARAGRRSSSGAGSGRASGASSSSSTSRPARSSSSPSTARMFPRRGRNARSSSDLLSDQLEIFGRDRIYEEAVSALSAVPALAKRLERGFQREAGAENERILAGRGDQRDGGGQSVLRGPQGSARAGQPRTLNGSVKRRTSAGGARARRGRRKAATVPIVGTTRRSKPSSASAASCWYGLARGHRASYSSSVTSARARPCAHVGAVAVGVVGEEIAVDVGHLPLEGGSMFGRHERKRDRLAAGPKSAERARPAFSRRGRRRRARRRRRGRPRGRPVWTAAADRGPHHLRAAGDVARHRAGRVEGRGKRPAAVHGHGPVRRLEADDAAAGGRNADRARASRCRARRRRGPAASAAADASARAARIAVGRERVGDVPEVLVLGRDPVGELVQVRLARRRRSPQPRGARPPMPSAPARARRRSPTRRSSAGRPCRRGP